MSRKDTYTREGDKRFTLRIEQSIFDRLEESARKNKRAIGREIEYILENFFSLQDLENKSTVKNKGT